MGMHRAPIMASTSTPTATVSSWGSDLYQLVRLSGDVTDHTFEIRFLAPGATAYSFTFG
jgi:Thioredoxin like C-terminal domain